VEYLLAYVGVGIFFAFIAIFHEIFSRDKIFVASLLMIVFWPLIAIAAPETLFRSQSSSSYYPDDVENNKDILKEKIQEYLATESTGISESERNRISRVAKYGYDEVCIFSEDADFEDIFKKLWDTNLHPKIYYSYLRSIRYLDEKYDPELEPKFSINPPDWYIGFSNEFVKSISKIDRKKQGRILEAISKISLNPIEVKGDTIKPLTGDLSGLWRCRLGHDRLLYFPDIEAKRIVLITFSARGDVYESPPNVSNLARELR